MSLATDAGDAAATFILSRNKTMAENDWDTVIEYLQDTFPTSYGDMDEDDILALNQRKMAELVLKTLLTGVDYQNRLEILANKWLNRPKKRPRDHAAVVMTRRELEERRLQTNDEKLESCTRPPMETGIAVNNTKVRMMMDSTLAGYSISIPQQDYAQFHTITYNLFVELQSGSQRVFARVQGFHTHDSDMIHISPKIEKMFAFNVNTAYFRLCTGALPLTAIKLRFYGTPDEFRSDAFVPQHFVDELKMMPLVSRGQTIMDAYGHVVRIESLYTFEGQEVFVAEIPSQLEEREISFQFDPEPIGCNVCLSKSSGMYCSAACGIEASKMLCGTCGEKATHICSACNIVGYCSTRCQRADWHSIHSKLCGAGVKRESSFRNDDDDDNRNPRGRYQQPAGYNFSPQVQDQLQNVRFLQQYIEHYGLEYIQEYVFNAEDESSFEYALDHTNLFWYLVRKYMIAQQPFNPLVNYRAMF